MTTTIESSGAGRGPPPRFLLATAEGGLRVFALPEDGAVTIGRGDECDVVLEHAKVSRQHARLEVGDPCRIADLGSRNGTFVRGHRLAADEARDVSSGDSFAVGPFALLLLPPGTAPPIAVAGGAVLRIEDPAPEVAPPLLIAIARSTVNVVIRGETGAGKEVLAATLHRLSGRAGQLVGLNCAALGESLLESELFGHERGAFTGAVAAKPGLLEAARGGTVLLDEIGDMAPALQAKLLRAIESREVYRVGGVKPVAIDVRFLAASHRDLVTHGDFRRDLYFRLAGMTLEVPPLRERRARIPGIAAGLLAAGGRAPPTLSAAATSKLVAHAWPGNVRELRNVLERALLLSGGGEIRPEHVLFDAPAPAAAAPAPAPASTAAADPPDAERARIIAALEACAGNQTLAAKLLGISRATLVTKLSIHRIPRPRGKPTR